MGNKNPKIIQKTLCAGKAIAIIPFSSVLLLSNPHGLLSQAREPKSNPQFLILMAHPSSGFVSQHSPSRGQWSQERSQILMLHPGSSQSCWEQDTQASNWSIWGLDDPWRENVTFQAQSSLEKGRNLLVSGHQQDWPATGHLIHGTAPVQPLEGNSWGLFLWIQQELNLSPLESQQMFHFALSSIFSFPLFSPLQHESVTKFHQFV